MIQNELMSSLISLRWQAHRGCCEPEGRKGLSESLIGSIWQLGNLPKRGLGNVGAWLGQGSGLVGAWFGAKTQITRGKVGVWFGQG